MSPTIIKAIVKKDLADIFRNNTLLITIIVIPIIFSVVIPLAIVGSAVFFDLNNLVEADVRKMIDTLLNELKGDAVILKTVEQRFVYLFINYILPSLFLLVPIITASTVAAASFVGEKESRTLEGLLFSPITIKELFVSKVIASSVPSLLVSIISFLLCGIIINGLGYSIFNEMIFPSPNWIALITCLSPMVTIMTVLFNVLISARVKTFQEAQNIGGVIVLPVIALIAGQASGIFLLGVKLTLLISLVILIINLILLQKIAKHNDRFLLFEKQIH